MKKAPVQTTLAIALLGLLALPLATSAQAANRAAAGAPGAEWVVLAGAAHPTDSTVPYNYATYYPSALQVHRGDTVEWRFTGSTNGWMSVTFYPGDMDVREHPRPLDSLIDPFLRPATPPYLAFTDQWLLGNEGGTRGVAPSAPCGRGLWLGSFPAQPPCVLHTTGQYVSSSLYDRFFDVTDAGSFRVRIDLPEGTYRYHCKYHPAMVGTVQVVGGSISLPTQHDIDQRARTEIARDTAAADAVVHRDSDLATAYDRTTHQWTIHVGDATPDHSVMIDDYMPEDVTVRPGDTVRWVAGADFHTVTFPPALKTPGWGSSAAGTCTPSSCTAPLGYLSDLGNPLTTSDYRFDCQAYLPGVGTVTLPTWNPTTFECPEGTRVEFLAGPLAAREQHAPGDKVLQGAFHNSGFMNPSSYPANLRARGDGSYLPSTFDAHFPAAGEYQFFCKIHPEFMNGIIRVVA